MRENNTRCPGTEGRKHIEFYSQWNSEDKILCEFFHPETILRVYQSGYIRFAAIMRSSEWLSMGLALCVDTVSKREHLIGLDSTINNKSLLPRMNRTPGGLPAHNFILESTGLCFYGLFTYSDNEDAKKVYEGQRQMRYIFVRKPIAYSEARINTQVRGDRNSEIFGSWYSAKTSKRWLRDPDIIVIIFVCE